MSFQCLWRFDLQKGPKFSDFLFSSLADVSISKWGLHLKLRICSYRSKFFPLRVDPIENGGKNENGRVASPESISIHLKTFVQKV